ncbi:MAG: AMP-binding protein, partial [Verrucomicrobiota bacterium]
LRNWQVNRLRRYLKETVLPFSQHYRDLEIRPEALQDFSDLASLPFTQKRNLIPTEEEPKRPRNFVLIPDQEVLKRRSSTIIKALCLGRARVQRDFEKEFRPIMMTSTTGRSTAPVPFLYTAHDLENLKTTGIRLMEICGSRPEFKHLNLFPFAPHLAFWQTHYAGIGFNTFNIDTGGGRGMGTDASVSLMGRVKPDAIIGMPTFIYHVLRQAVEEGLTWKNLRKVVLGGEKVPNGMRGKLRALAAELGSGKVDVLATYGFTEAKTAWPECPHGTGESTGYHLSPDLGIIEIIDPDTGEQVPDGSPGEIVYTALDARGSVVLRYRTGDEISGGLTYAPCPSCGRTVPRLLGAISRVSDYRRLRIGKLKGTLVNFNELEHILDDIEEIGTWQMEIRNVNDDPLAGDEIIVHISRNPSRRDGGRDELRRLIRRKFQVGAELTPNRVEFHSAESIRTKQGVGENLKEEKVVDCRRRDQEIDSSNNMLSKVPNSR